MDVPPSGAQGTGGLVLWPRMWCLGCGEASLVVLCGSGAVCAPAVLGGLLFPWLLCGSGN